MKHSGILQRTESRSDFCSWARWDVSLLAVPNNNVRWAWHCRVSSSPECRPTSCAVPPGCQRCEQGRRRGVLNIAPSPRFLSSLRSVSLFLLPLELLKRHCRAGQHTQHTFLVNRAALGGEFPVVSGQQMRQGYLPYPVRSLLPRVGPFPERCLS